MTTVREAAQKAGLINQAKGPDYFRSIGEKAKEAKSRYVTAGKVILGPGYNHNQYLAAGKEALSPKKARQRKPYEGEMTMAEAAARSHEATARNHGPEFFQERASKGGTANFQKNRGGQYSQTRQRRRK